MNVLVDTFIFSKGITQMCPQVVCTKYLIELEYFELHERKWVISIHIAEADRPYLEVGGSQIFDIKNWNKKVAHL